MTDINIIHEDEDLLIVNKPAGLGTQAPRAFDSLEARVRAYLLSTCGADQSPYLGIPHRLDRCVSGVLVLAKKKKAARLLSRQFERREVEKSYWAVVSGAVQPEAGEWQDYVRKIPDEPRAEIVPHQNRDAYPDAKLAILQFHTISTSDDFSQLKVRLETGRMHQIRVQCAAHGFPVVGDKHYGSVLTLGEDPQHERDRKIALHAHELRIEHPRHREHMAFTAPLPSIWPTPL